MGKVMSFPTPNRKRFASNLSFAETYTPSIKQGISKEIKREDVKGPATMLEYLRQQEEKK